MRETGNMRKIIRVKAKETKKEGFKEGGSDQKYCMQPRNLVRKALKNMDSI